MFDNRLLKLREKTGKSKKEVADALQMPYTTYLNYEADLREPSSEVLIKLADFYGVSIDYLLGHELKSGVDRAFLKMNLDAAKKERTREELHRDIRRASDKTILRRQMELLAEYSRTDGVDRIPEASLVLLEIYRELNKENKDQEEVETKCKVKSG